MTRKAERWVLRGRTIKALLLAAISCMAMKAWAQQFLTPAADLCADKLAEWESKGIDNVPVKEMERRLNLMERCIRYATTDPSAAAVIFRDAFELQQVYSSEENVRYKAFIDRHKLHEQFEFDGPAQALIPWLGRPPLTPDENRIYQQMQAYPPYRTSEENTRYKAFIDKHELHEQFEIEDQAQAARPTKEAEQ